MYISFRHFSIIPFLYVSITYTKTIIIIAAIFNAGNVISNEVFKADEAFL